MPTPTEDCEPAIFDPDSAIRLGNNWRMAMAIGPDGSAWPWLFDPSRAGSDDDGSGIDGMWPPLHERLGPLPPVWSGRVESVMDRNRCQAITLAGERCSRTRVGVSMCWQHAMLEAKRGVR